MAGLCATSARSLPRKSKQREAEKKKKREKPGFE